MYGQASLLLGPSSDWPILATQDDIAQTIWPYYHDEDVPEFAESASFGGDINGDGLPDAIIDVRGEIRAYILLGTADPINGVADLSDSPSLGYVTDPYGFSGDQDGDGQSDVLMGGSSYYWFSATSVDLSGFSDPRDYMTWLPGAGAGECDKVWSNGHILTLGDWSGDGVDDVAVICEESAGAPDGAHAIHVIDGAQLPLAERETPIWNLSLGSYAGGAEPMPGQAFTVDDIDHDGKRDLVISAMTKYTNRRGGSEWDSEQTLFPSSAGMPGPYDPWPENAVRYRTNLGIEGTSDLHFAGMGDHNADGFLDLAVGIVHDPANSTIDTTHGDVSWHYMLGWDIPWDDPLYW